MARFQRARRTPEGGGSGKRRLDRSVNLGLRAQRSCRCSTRQSRLLRQPICHVSTRATACARFSKWHLHPLLIVSHATGRCPRALVIAQAL
jgi:hypothetical protein